MLQPEEPYFGYTFSALYTGLSLVQFTCKSEKTLTPTPMAAHGVRVIFDDGAVFRDYARRCKEMPDPYPALFEKCVSTFWVRAVLVRDALRKGRVWLAGRHLVDMRDEMLMLVRIKLRSLGYAFNRPAKNAEVELPAAVLSQIAQVVSHCNVESLRLRAYPNNPAQRNVMMAQTR